MKTSFKIALLASAALGLVSTQGFAQSADGANSNDTTEVVVSARRRDETLKNVPIAVTAYSSERLARTGASDITSLQQTTPNLTLQVARGSNSTLIAFIRGVGQQDPLWGFEPGVGLYVDDVYIARPQGAVLDIYDVQRIEILRGPQGTLYGRNTIGGAVKYVTKPLGDMPAFNAKVNLGSYNQRDITLSGSMPLSEGFAIGAAVTKQDRDGYGKNLTTGAEHYNKDVLAYRLSAEYEGDKFSARLAYDNYLDKSNARHGHREVPVSTTTTVTAEKVTPDVYDTYAGLGDKNEVKTDGASLTMSYKLNEKWTLKSITASRKGHTDTLIDFDNTPSKYLDVPAYYQDGQVSQELQLLYTGENWSTVAGAYYLNATAEGAFDTIVSTATIYTAGKVNTKSLAFFFDSNVKVTDKFSMSFGLRSTEDSKKGSVFRATYLGTPSPRFGGTQTSYFLLRTNYTNSRDFSKITPRISASYIFSPTLTGYASISSGFKSGGFDMRGDANILPQTVNGYQPETVLTKEIGLKGSLFNDRLNFSSAIFTSEYTDMQITRQTVVPGSTTAIASQVENAGSATIQGVEFEGNLKLTSNLSATAAIGYVDTKFDEYISYSPVSQSYINAAGLFDIQNTPEWTNSFSLTYRGEFMGGNLIITPQASYRSDMQLFEAANTQLDQEAFWLYDLGASWTAPGGHYKVGLYGKNLNDERYRVGGYPFGSIANSVIGFYGPPRTVMLSLEYKY